MKKKKLKSVKSSKIPPQSLPSDLPKDLTDKWGAVEAVATSFNLMQKGTFPFSHMRAVEASLAFLAKLHEQTVEDALKHPQADMIPELKALKEGKAAEDGKTEEQ